MVHPAHDTRAHLEKVVWRHDLKPLQVDFGDTIKGMEKAYWKTDTIGSDVLPGGETYIKGFIVLDQNELEKLKAEYSWEKTEIDFPQGLKPEITGYHDFDWATNVDFENKVFQGEFMGDICLDFNHGVIFVDVEM